MGDMTREEFLAFKETAKSEHEKLIAEDSRQNKRLDKLEHHTDMIMNLSRQIERVSTNVENLVKELGKHTERLSALECKDGQMWRNAVGYVVAGVIGVGISQILMR